MAAMVFPTSPTVGQTYSSGNSTWSWNGTTWDAVLTLASPIVTGTITTALGAGVVKSSAGGVLSSGAIAESDVTNLTTDLAAKAPAASPTFTGTAVSSGTLKIKPVIETATLVSTGFAGYTYDALSNAVVLITGNSTANGTLNIRGNSGTSLGSMLGVGESITVALVVTNGPTAYYVNAINIDGSSMGVFTTWLGGTAPTSGNSSAMDAYTVTVVKTAASAYTVFASVSKFA